jgi:serine phosphatase RsbU (regulator of sigma subunit)
MIAGALSLHFLVRVTIFPMISRFTGQTNFMVVGGWRVRLTALTLTVLGATTLIVFARALIRDRAEKQRLATEFEAARAVQQVLVPEEIPAAPGFRIEAVYRPFGEVGGDFFQILPIAEGVLVVVGDVSGKGMPAAMMVSLLVGTVRTLADYTQSPGEILAAMNARMIGRSNGGFTTCVVLRAERDGKLTVANAGHIAPYVAGKELKLESGLPLGLAADAGYAEATFVFRSGERLTLVTDGVVEARSKSGELLGFERTAELSVGTADAIADAAQAFGQDDDITVLTIGREG